MEQKVLDSKLVELKSRIEPKTYKNNANDVSTRLSDFIYEKYVSEMEEGLKKDDFNVDSYCFKFIYPVALTKSEVAFLVDNDKLKLKTNFNQDWNLPLLSLLAQFFRQLGIRVELRVIGFNFDYSPEEFFYVQVILTKDYYVKPKNIKKGYTIQVRKRNENISSFKKESGEFVYPEYLVMNRFKDFQSRFMYEGLNKPIVEQEERGYQSKDTSFLTMKDWVKLTIIVVIGTVLTAKLGLLF